MSGRPLSHRIQYPFDVSPIVQVERQAKGRPGLLIPPSSKLSFRAKRGICFFPSVIPPRACPRIRSRNGHPAVLTIHFDKALDEDAARAVPVSAYVVTVDGQDVTITVTSVFFGDTVILSVPGAAIRQGQTVIVSYTDPTAGNDTVALQDRAGNDVAGFTTGRSGVPAVTNGSTVPSADTTPPEVEGVVVNEVNMTVSIIFDEALDANAADAVPVSAFSVTADGQDVEITHVRISFGDTVILEFPGAAIRQGQIVVVSYTDPTAGDDIVALQDVAGNDVASFSVTANTPATGAPTITGTVEVGKTLTAVTTGIMDANGLTGVTYDYQWIRVDGTEASIARARSSTYLLVAADLGKTIKVEVGFRDADGYLEMRISAATAVVAADTTPPEVGPAEVGTGGNTVAFAFNEALDEDAADVLPVSAYAVTADGQAVEITHVRISLGDTVILQLPDAAIRQGQTVVVSYADPTAGNDTVALQDVAGNDVASFAVPATNKAVIPPSTPAPDTTEVYDTWSLKPSDVTAGERFRLLFVTSTKKNAGTTLIGGYNGIIQRAARAGHPDIRAYRSSFRVLGSTATVHARDNTSTTYTASDTGVPIYYLNGEKVADDYESFYDGTWDSHSPTNEFGTSSSATAVWTGSQSAGTTHDTEPLGTRTDTKRVRMGNPTSSVSGAVLSANHIPNNSYKDRSYLLPFYGLSPVFQVRAITAPGVPEKFTARRDDERVTLTWAAPASDGGAAITRYEYRHAAGTSMPSVWNSAGPAQSVTVTGLENGTEYTFQVRAVNSVHGGLPASVTATPTARTTFTQTTLVSNFGQPGSRGQVRVYSRIAQNFTTGPNLREYTLEGIEIRVADHKRVAVSLCPVEGENQVPGSGCTELTAPAYFGARKRLSFAAPASHTLAANTTYAVVLSGYDVLEIATTASDAEDTPAAQGWSIGDGYRLFNSSRPDAGFWPERCLSFAIPLAVRGLASSGQQAVEPPVITGAPSVSEAGADGQWTPGETVEATVTFSEAVTVDTSGGTPAITLTLGGTGGTQARSASYASGSSTGMRSQ